MVHPGNLSETMGALLYSLRAISPLPRRQLRSRLSARRAGFSDHHDVRHLERAVAGLRTFHLYLVAVVRFQFGTVAADGRALAFCNQHPRIARSLQTAGERVLPGADWRLLLAGGRLRLRGRLLLLLLVGRGASVLGEGHAGSQHQYQEDFLGHVRSYSFEV